MIDSAHIIFAVLAYLVGLLAGAAGADSMMRLFLRAWLMVSCVASNTVFLADRQWVAAGFGGFLISWLWWGNAHDAAHVERRWARVVYASGAACGTLTGLAFASWLSAWIR